jgi:hypothetical protein
MTEKQAVHYGEVEIIPGIKCDGYVLDDGTACLSERGTADLLGRPIRLYRTWQLLAFQKR